MYFDETCNFFYKEFVVAFTDQRRKISAGKFLQKSSLGSRSSAFPEPVPFYCWLISHRFEQVKLEWFSNSGAGATVQWLGADLDLG